MARDVYTARRLFNFFYDGSTGLAGWLFAYFYLFARWYNERNLVFFLPFLLSISFMKKHEQRSSLGRLHCLL